MLFLHRFGSALNPTSTSTSSSPTVSSPRATTAPFTFLGGDTPLCRRGAPPPAHAPALRERVTALASDQRPERVTAHGRDQSGTTPTPAPPRHPRAPLIPRRRAAPVPAGFPRPGVARRATCAPSVFRQTLRLPSSPERLVFRSANRTRCRIALDSSVLSSGRVLGVTARIKLRRETAAWPRHPSRSRWAAPARPR